MCNTEGSIVRLLLAFSADAEAALSGSTLDISSFEEVADFMPYPYYTEQAQPDEHGTTYTSSISFSLLGESSTLYSFEKKYINAELGALCILPNGQMKLFTRLSLSRQAKTGQSPSDFSGRDYSLSGNRSEEAIWIETLV
jgi:hypothetical protein